MVSGLVLMYPIFRDEESFFFSLGLGLVLFVRRDDDSFERDEEDVRRLSLRLGGIATFSFIMCPHFTQTLSLKATRCL
jgi:hypothetical protein